MLKHVHTHTPMHMCNIYFLLTLIGGDWPVSTHAQVAEKIQYAMVLEKQRKELNPIVT